MNERRHQQTLELRYIRMRSGTLLKTAGQLLHNQCQGRPEQMTCCDTLKAWPEELICTTQVVPSHSGDVLSTTTPSKHTEVEFVCASWSVSRLFFMGKAVTELIWSAHLPSMQQLLITTPCVKLSYTMLCGHYSVDPRSIKWTFYITSNEPSTSHVYLLHMCSLKKLIHPTFPPKRPHRVI